MAPPEANITAETAGDLFVCGDGLHALWPAGGLDPTGTTCRCGALVLVGIMTALTDGGVVPIVYLIGTTPPDLTLPTEHPT